MPEGTTPEDGELHLFASLQVPHEIVFQPADSLLVEQQRVNFEIAEEAAQIHIGRSDGSDKIVDDQHLGMDKTLLVPVNPPPRRQQLFHKGEGGEQDKL